MAIDIENGMMEVNIDNQIVKRRIDSVEINHPRISQSSRPGATPVMHYQPEIADDEMCLHVLGSDIPYIVKRYL